MRKAIYRRCVMPAFIVIAFGCGLALGSDADLQQYNGTASFAADWTAQAKLLVRDGKKITADDNGAGKAPVNRGLKQVIDIVGGIHDGIFGSAPGAVRRTVKSLEADGTGGAVSTLLAGGIASNTANDRSLMTPTDVSVFKISPTGGETKITKGAVTFTNTADGGGNPARTTAVNNAVVPLNIAKAWVNLTTPSGVMTYGDGYNISSCTVQSNTEIYCDMAVTLDNTGYAVMPVTGLGSYVECINTTATRFTCSFGGTADCNSAPGCKLSAVVFGRQTT